MCLSFGPRAALLASLATCTRRLALPSPSLTPRAGGHRSLSPQRDVVLFPGLIAHTQGPFSVGRGGCWHLGTRGTKGPIDAGRSPAGFCEPGQGQGASTALRGAGGAAKPPPACHVGNLGAARSGLELGKWGESEAWAGVPPTTGAVLGFDPRLGASLHSLAPRRAPEHCSWRE